MKLPLKLLLSLVILLLAYQLMGFGLALLNKPSGRAVYEGLLTLFLLGFSFPYALWRVWRRYL